MIWYLLDVHPDHANITRVNEGFKIAQDTSLATHRWGPWMAKATFDIGHLKVGGMIGTLVFTPKQVDIENIKSVVHAEPLCEGADELQLFYVHAFCC